MLISNLRITRCVLTADLVNGCFTKQTVLAIVAEIKISTA